MTPAAPPEPPRLTARLAEAVAYAIEAHQGQRRKGTAIPYVAHVLGVAALVLEHGGDETEAVAALLHDAVEDAGGAPRLADIRRRFGDEVALIVDACTDTDLEPKPPWLDRKRAYLAHFAAKPERALRVAAADKLHNLQAILRDYRTHGEALWARFNAPRDGILWYYRSLLAHFQARGPASLAVEIARVLAAIEAETAPRP